MDDTEHAWRSIALLADLPADRPVEVAAANQSIILVHTAGGIAAYQGICPHAAARLARGHIADGWLHCPQHKAAFRLSDGTCGKGWRLPALRRYATKVENGTVYLADPLREIGQGG
jgi:nitrite reductase/ring-hydroxylating ferredoxin subunit